MQRSFFSRLLFFGVLFGLLAAEAQAQYETRGTSAISVGGGGPAFVRETDAIFLNPANMTIRDRPGNLMISLVGLSVFLGGDIFQFTPYEEGFTGGANVSGQAAVDLLDDWFGTGGQLRRANLFTDFNILSISYRQANWAAGLGVRVRANSKVGLNRGLPDLLLRGTEEARTIPMDFEFRVYGSTDISFAFAYHLPQYKLHVGIAPKVVLGGFYNDGRFEGDLVVADTENNPTQPHVMNFTYQNQSAGNITRDLLAGINLFDPDNAGEVNFEFPFLTTDGFGYGVDLGVTYEAMPDLYVSASITDLGFIKWTGDAQTLTPVNDTFTLKPVEDTNKIFDELSDNIEDTFQETNEDEEPFTAALPTSGHLGASWDLLGGRANVNGGLSMALNNQPGNIAQFPRVYVGGAYYLGPVPIRAGVRALGRGALAVAFGTGIRTRYFDFEIGGAGTLDSDLLGPGARFTVGFSALKFRI